MPLDDISRLRGLIAERVPTPGSPADTLFTDEEIQDFIDQASGNIRAAAYIGWIVKAGEFANLADVVEGNSARNLSDLAAAAEKAATNFLADAQAAGIVPAQGVGRVRIGTIQRSGGAIQ